MYCVPHNIVRAPKFKMTFILEFDRMVFLTYFRRTLSRSRAQLILGTNQNSTQEEIRNSYLEKVKKYHPGNFFIIFFNIIFNNYCQRILDVSGNIEGQLKFGEISEAFELLKNLPIQNKSIQRSNVPAEIKSKRNYEAEYSRKKGIRLEYYKTATDDAKMDYYKSKKEKVLKNRRSPFSAF